MTTEYDSVDRDELRNLRARLLIMRDGLNSVRHNLNRASQRLPEGESTIRACVEEFSMSLSETESAFDDISKQLDIIDNVLATRPL